MNSQAQEIVHCSKINGVNNLISLLVYIFICTYNRYMQNQLMLLYAMKGK